MRNLEVPADSWPTREGYGGMNAATRACGFEPQHQRLELHALPLYYALFERDLNPLPPLSDRQELNLGTSICSQGYDPHTVA